MKYRKVKGGVEIKVEDWSSEVVLSHAATGTRLGSETFSNHIVAVEMARRLYSSN